MNIKSKSNLKKLNNIFVYINLNPVIVLESTLDSKWNPAKMYAQITHAIILIFFLVSSCNIIKR